MRPPADQRPYWNRAARRKTFGHAIDFGLLARHVPRAGAVLDLGCGYGRAVRALVDRGWRRTVGVDTAGAMVQRGRDAWPDLDLRALDPGPLPFADASFDAVVCFSVLTCVPDEQAAGALLDEARRVLRPGGVLYASDLLLQEDDRNRRRYAAGEARFGATGVFELDEGVVLRHYPRETVDALFRVLERVDWRRVAVRTMNGHAARAFHLLARRPV